MGSLPRPRLSVDRLERIQQDPSAAAKEKTAALRGRDKLEKALSELRQHEMLQSLDANLEATIRLVPEGIDIDDTLRGSVARNGNWGKEAVGYEPKPSPGLDFAFHESMILFYSTRRRAQAVHHVLYR